MPEHFLTESFLEFPDNSSHCVIFYMRGCPHSCEGCHNAELREYKPFDIGDDDIIEIIRDYCHRSHTDRLCLQGGDPLYFRNIGLTRRILSELGGELSICVYTGYDIAYVRSLGLGGFQYVKCGPYRRDLCQRSCKTDDYMCLASANQELYDGGLRLLSHNGIYHFN